MSSVFRRLAQRCRLQAQPSTSSSSPIGTLTRFFHVSSDHGHGHSHGHGHGHGGLGEYQEGDKKMFNMTMDEAKDDGEGWEAVGEDGKIGSEKDDGQERNTGNYKKNVNIHFQAKVTGSLLSVVC